MDFYSHMQPKFNQQIIQKILLLRSISPTLPKELIYLIMEPMIASRCVLEVTMSRIVLCQIFEILNSTINDCCIKILSHGLEIKQLTPKKDSLIHVWLDSRKFNQFYCEKYPMHFSILIKKVLSPLYETKSSTITLRLYSNVANYLEIDFGGKRNIELYYTIPFNLHTSNILRKIQHENFRYLVDTHTFFSICKKMWNYFALIVLNNSHSISHNQETYTMEKSKIICYYDELRFNHLDPNIECIAYDQVFELKLIMLFQNFEKLCDNMNIFIHDEMPLLLEIGINDNTKNHHTTNIVGIFRVFIIPY